MKEVRRYSNVQFLGLYDGDVALWYPDRLEVGSVVVPVERGDDFAIWDESRYLSRRRNHARMILDGGDFVEWPQGRYGKINRINDYAYSKKYGNGVCSLSLIQGDKENLVDVVFDGFEPDLVNIVGDVIMLSDCVIDCHALLFYSRTGERLWEYREEEANQNINSLCIPVVDDVVVVISQESIIPEKIQGFNIKTGEKLWHLDLSEIGCSNTFFVGEDKMLYGCITCYKELLLFRLNPYTGSLESWKLLSDKDLDVMSWLVTMHGQRLYYTDNRRGNEIGVIDVDRRELVERVPLNIEKKVTIGAPVVSDDKVYVFIRDLRELRVFEK